MKNFTEYITESTREWEKIERIQKESYAALEKIVGKKKTWDNVKYKDTHGRGYSTNWNAFWSAYSRASLEHPELINKDTWKTILSYNVNDIDQVKKIFSKYRPNKTLIINTMRKIAKNLVMGPSSDFVMSKLSEEEITSIIREAVPMSMWISRDKNNMIRFFYDKGKVTFDKAHETNHWSWRDMGSYLPVYYKHDREFFKKIITADNFEFPKDFFLNLFDENGGGFHDKETIEKFIQTIIEYGVYDKFEECILNTKDLSNRELRKYTNLTIEKILPKELIEKYYHKYRGSITGKKYGV